MKYLIILSLFLVGMVVFAACQGTKQSPVEDQTRKEAIEYYEKALKLEAEKDYYAAKKCYEKSLKLYEDEKVNEAYIRLLSAIGPM